MVLSLLGEWQRRRSRTQPRCRFWQEIPDAGGTLAAVSIAGSLLLAAGDPSGAALVWAMSQVISDERQFQIIPLDRDDEAIRQSPGRAW